MIFKYLKTKNLILCVTERAKIERWMDGDCHSSSSCQSQKNKLDLTPLRLITAMRTLLTLANVAVIHVARLTGN